MNSPFSILHSPTQWHVELLLIFLLIHQGTGEFDIHPIWRTAKFRQFSSLARIFISFVPKYNTIKTNTSKYLLQTKIKSYDICNQNSLSLILKKNTINLRFTKFLLSTYFCASAHTTNFFFLKYLLKLVPERNRILIRVRKERWTILLTNNFCFLF